MHFEILVEDQSGKHALEILVPRIIDETHTCRVISYKGIGRIPKNLNAKADPAKRILLQRLPELLRGYGKTYSQNTKEYAVVLVCDLDDRCLKELRQELLDILDNCHPRPRTCFCIAVEEGEAWLLGDVGAVKRAYPKAKDAVLENYGNDSICGTWEVLADAIYSGGSKMLKSGGWQVIGAQKSVWATMISPYIDVENNKSPSFCYFRGKLRDLAGQPA
jgi:hypothetical protein